MNKLLCGFLVLFISNFSYANADIKYADLYTMKGRVDIRDVKAIGVVENKNMEQAVLNPTAIKLEITGKYLCQQSILTSNNKGILRFYSIGKFGIDLSAACVDKIEYYWTPEPLEIATGTSKTMRLKVFPHIKNVAGKATGKYFTVSVVATKKEGKLPGNGGYGYYFTYSKLRVVSPR